MKLPSNNVIPAEFSKTSFRSFLLLGGDWLTIFGAVTVATKFPGVLTFIAAQWIIASRQHALFLTMHEGTHYLLSKNKVWNDRISNWFASWPVGMSTERYRERHWTHHRHLNTDQDPDWVRKKADPTWQFPMEPRRFWQTSLAHLFGKGFIEMFYALRGIGVERKDLLQVIPYYGAIAFLFSMTGTWHLFALYWVLPYFTAQAFLHRVRNISEHLGLPKTHALNGTRDIVGSPIESFFFGPHNASLHLVHHEYPFVPCYRLPALRKYLLETSEVYRAHAHWNRGYFLPSGTSVYNDITNTKPSISQELKNVA